ncbi:hypothetical protein QTP88_018054 [Uroleucon formosanum]
MAIKFVNKNENEKYIILSDSLSSLISIKNKFNPSDIAIQIQNRLEEAKRKNNIIILIWITGHIGIDGNEKADRQAKLATRSNDAQHINISQYTDVRKQIKQNTISLWQNIWYTQTNKLNQIKQTVKRWKRNTNISITEEKKLNRARIGHTNMTHGYLMAKDDPPICQQVLSPLFTYAYPIWGKCAQIYLKELQMFQNKETITKASWFVRNLNIHKDFKIPYLQDHTKHLAVFFFKSIHKSTSLMHYPST